LLFTAAQLEGPTDPTSCQAAALEHLLTVARERLRRPTAKVLETPAARNLFVWDATSTDLAVAFLRTGDRRFLDHAVDLIRAIPPVWRDVPKSKDMFDPCLITMLVKFDSLVGPHLDPEDRDQVSRLVGTIATRFLRRFERAPIGAPDRVRWNHSIMAAAGLGMAGLARPDHPDGKAWLEIGLDRFRSFLDVGVTEAGMTWEGLHYCGFVFKLLGPLLNGLRNTGREHLVAPEGSAASRKLHLVPRWYAHDMWPRGTWLQAYNDSRPDPASALMGFLPGFVHYEPELCTAVWSMLVGAHGNETYGENKRFSSLADSVLYLPDIEPDPTVLEQLPLDLHCAEIGYVASRDRWGPDATVFTFNCGALPDKLHDHSDNLSFTLTSRGEPVVVDSGSANIRREGSPGCSEGHNLVFVDGRAEALTGEGAWIDGEMVAVEHAGTHVAAVGDATASYLHEGYNPVHHALRHCLFVRGPVPYLLVLDDIRKDDTAHRYEHRVHVIDPPRLLGPGSADLAHAVGVVVHPPATETELGTYTCLQPPFKEHHTVGFSTHAVNPEMVTLYLPSDGQDALEGSEVSAEEDGLVVRLRWRNGTDEVRFALHDVVGRAGLRPPSLVRA
jgi:Heparinase II/III-like protein